MNNIISDGKHLLSGVCEINVKCGLYDDSTAEGVVLTIDGRNYVAYTDPDDGYRSYGCFHEDNTYKQKNPFPPQEVIVSNEDWDEEDENGWPHRGDKIVIYNPETKEEIFSCGTDHSDDYYPVGFWHYHPENFPINKDKDDEDKVFEDALSALRRCLNMVDEHEESVRVPTEKNPEITEYVKFEPSPLDADIDKAPAFDANSVTATQWEIMEHTVRENVKRKFQKFLDEKFDSYDTNQLLAMWEDFSEKW